MAGLFVKDMRLILRNKPYVVLFILLTIMLGFSQEGTFVLGVFSICNDDPYHKYDRL